MLIPPTRISSLGMSVVGADKKINLAAERDVKILCRICRMYCKTLITYCG